MKEIYDNQYYKLQIKNLEKSKTISDNKKFITKYMIFITLYILIYININVYKVKKCEKTRDILTMRDVQNKNR